MEKRKERAYEVFFWKVGPSGKRKVKIRKFVRHGEVVKEKMILCEVEVDKGKSMQGFEIVHLKETDDVIECVMTLRRLGLDSCADEVEKWEDE